MFWLLSLVSSSLLLLWWCAGLGSELPFWLALVVTVLVIGYGGSGGGEGGGCDSGGHVGGCCEVGGGDGGGCEGVRLKCSRRSGWPRGFPCKVRCAACSWLVLSRCLPLRPCRRRRSCSRDHLSVCSFCCSRFCSWRKVLLNLSTTVPLSVAVLFHHRLMYFAACFWLKLRRRYGDVLPLQAFSRILVVGLCCCCCYLPAATPVPGTAVRAPISVVCLWRKFMHPFVLIRSRLCCSSAEDAVHAGENQHTHAWSCRVVLPPIAKEAGAVLCGRAGENWPPSVFFFFLPF